MEAGVLGKLMAELLLAIRALSGYEPSAGLPDLVFLPHAALAQQACERPCQVYGWFPPGRTIYLDDRLDPLNEVADRSILVHELVHFLQRESGSFPPSGDCHTWMARERQAYDIQLRWLKQQGVSRKALARIGFGPWKLSCPEFGERLDLAPRGERRAE